MLRANRAAAPSTASSLRTNLHRDKRAGRSCKPKRSTLLYGLAVSAFVAATCCSVGELHLLELDGGMDAGLEYDWRRCPCAVMTTNTTNGVLRRRHWANSPNLNPLPTVVPRDQIRCNEAATYIT